MGPLLVATLDSKNLHIASFNEFDPYLFKKSMEECGTNVRQVGFFVLQRSLADKIKNSGHIRFLKGKFPWGNLFQK